jgi:hypothetical protein
MPPPHRDSRGPGGAARHIARPRPHDSSLGALPGMRLASVSGMTRRVPPPDGESTVELLGGLIGDARDLAVAHLDGLRLEVSDQLAELKTSTKYAAAAAAVFAVGGLLAAFALVQALWMYTTVPTWAAYLIIAGVCFAGGALILAVRARRPRGIARVPATALDRVRRDARWVAD